ncbi:MAG: c-type cytochrome [Bauldia sp.]
MAIAAVLFWSAGGPALAQGGFTPDPALASLGKTLWKEQVPCRECHGGLGNGIPDIPQQPSGANLRTTKLSPEDLAITIRCGRPGTEMPYFDSKAYTDKRCYDVTAADLGPAQPPASMALTDRQVNALVAFIFATFVGKGDPTFESCVALWGEGASTCARYPRAGR